MTQLTDTKLGDKVFIKVINQLATSINPLAIDPVVKNIYHPLKDSALEHYIEEIESMVRAEFTD